MSDQAEPEAGQPGLALRILRYPLVLAVLEFILVAVIASLASVIAR